MMAEEQAVYEVEPEQVETDAPIEEQVETEQPEDTGETEQVDAEPEEHEPKRVPLAALEAERRKRQELEAKLEWLAQQQQQREQPQHPPEQPQGEPRLEDFDSYDAYTRAVRAYDRSLMQREFMTWQQQQTVQARQQEAFNGFRERAAKVEGKPADYSERIQAAMSDPSLPFTAAIAEVVLQDEAGPDLAYHLASHPEELYRLSRLSPARQAAEAGKLAARIAAKPLGVSSAPPPVKPVRGANATASVDPEKMTMDEWVKWRRKQVTKR
jgi:hypothetical protein